MFQALESKLIFLDHHVLYFDRIKFQDVWHFSGWLSFPQLQVNFLDKMPWLVFTILILYTKHDFLYALTSAGHRPEPERRRFQHFPRGTSRCNVSENHVWFLLLHKTFCHSKTLEKMLRKVLFSCTYNGAPANVLKTPLPGQMITSFWRHRNAINT